jgi:uncharacterized membrane protein
VRLFGHPLHAILVCFPVALLALTPLCDALAWLGVAPELARVGHYLELFGLVGGALALVPGFVDFYGLEAPSRELTRTALTHAALALTMLSIFGVAFALRGDSATEPRPVALLLELVGALVLGGVGWFGGHLVFAFRVGVDREPPR